MVNKEKTGSANGNGSENHEAVNRGEGYDSAEMLIASTKRNWQDWILNTKFILLFTTTGIFIT